MSNSPILDELGNLEEKPWKINSPVDKGRIAAFVQAGYVLPEDFQAVLAITDGIACGLGEQEIYGMDLLIELAEVNRGTLREGVYAFGYFWGETLILILPAFLQATISFMKVWAMTTASCWEWTLGSFSVNSFPPTFTLFGRLCQAKPKGFPILSRNGKTPGFHLRKPGVFYSSVSKFPIPCLTRSCSSALFASLNRSSVPTR